MQAAFVCPGQGSQTPGMGRELYEYSEKVRRIFEIGRQTLQRDLAVLCFDTPAETLNRTENAQTAIFTLSMAAAALLEDKGVTPAALAGFSLGECSALCIAGVLSLPDGFRLVAERGRLMQQAADQGEGAMAAVLGLAADTIRDLSQGMTARPVNFNCPGQTVIAGTAAGVAQLSALCKEAGARRVLPLGLSGAFHTEAMAPAAQGLQAFAQALTFHPPRVPVYTNLTGKPLPQETCLPGHLARQMQSPVLWQSSVETMVKDGFSDFIEVGWGSTLSKFIGKIDKQARLHSLSTWIA